MMWSGNGVGWVGWIMMTAGMLVIVALVVVAICALIPGGGRDRSRAPGGPEQNDKGKSA